MAKPQAVDRSAICRVVLSVVVLLGACDRPPAPRADTASAPAAAVPNDVACRPGSLPVSPPPPATVAWTEAGDAELGIGYLGPVQRAVTPETPDYLLVGFANADWLKQTVLPVYDAPAGEVQGWVACGWWVTASSSPTRLTPALFYPGYSGFGFLVLAEQAGWLRVRFGQSKSQSEAQAEIAGWVQRSDLQAGKVPLGYMSWRDRYTDLMAEQARYPDSPTASWGYLSFKDNPDTVTQALYQAPDPQAQQTSLSADHALLPLDIQGEWMRVRAYTPSNFCVEDWQGTTQTGWVRWLDPARGGNQMAEPYRGC